MKVAGLLLLVVGWAIVISAIILLPSPMGRGAFALSGLAVEVLGLALMVNSHMVLDTEKG